MHLADDVAASDELPVNIELRDRGPLRERLDPIPHLGGTQYIDRFIARLQLVEDLHHLGGEPALRHAARSLHEEDADFGPQVRKSVFGGVRLETWLHLSGLLALCPDCRDITWDKHQFVLDAIRRQ